MGLARKGWGGFAKWFGKRKKGVGAGEEREEEIMDTRALILMYLVFGAASMALARFFLLELMRTGVFIKDWRLWALFLSIPVVLIIFLGLSLSGLFKNKQGSRIGTRFQARLITYFFSSVLFSALPFAVLMGISLTEVLNLWRGTDTEQMIRYGEEFAVEAYMLRLQQFEEAVGNYEPGRFEKISPDLIGVQDFVLESGKWIGTRFSGEPGRELKGLPQNWAGFAPRDYPRDLDAARYVVFLGPDRARVFTCFLGTDFDKAIRLFNEERDRFELVDSLHLNLTPLFLFFYGVFLIPLLLTLCIIAVNFTWQVSRPLVELVNGTGRVARGDFSIHLLARRGDELGMLAHSFNTMVRELERQRVELMKAQKISLWQTMSQQLAHEIKNPLTPIKLSAERVLRRWRTAPERAGGIIESSMLAIIQEAEGISRLLDEFRTLARPMEPSRSWTWAEEAVVEAAAPYQSSHPGVRFSIEGADGRRAAVLIDRHRLGQILANLLLNAIDAMDGAGAVEIRIDVVRKRDSRFCRISVKDTGRGIEPEDEGRIFTPYFTTKESGTGLGLPIVERIVNEHDGNIWFHSAPAVGTTFFVDLPLAGNSAEGRREEKHERDFDH
jgi:nitrogen fixation/metabolism regulation signal transduction histidine kinase